MTYDIIDEVSGLIIKPYTDELIRKMAMENEEEPEQLWNRLKVTLAISGIHYWITMKFEIMPMPKGAMTKGGGWYRDTYEEALEAISFMKKEE